MPAVGIPAQIDFRIGLTYVAYGLVAFAAGDGIAIHLHTTWRSRIGRRQDGRAVIQFDAEHLKMTHAAVLTLEDRHFMLDIRQMLG